MPFPQPTAEQNVLKFIPRAAPLAGLSPRDRIDICQWQIDAKARGYDRLVIHEREPGDAPEVGSFVTIHREGQAWSSWGLTRQAGKVVVWSTTKTEHLGPFSSVSEAMAAILGLPRITASAEIVIFATAICG